MKTSISRPIGLSVLRLKGVILKKSVTIYSLLLQHIPRSMNLLTPLSMTLF